MRNQDYQGVARRIESAVNQSIQKNGKIGLAQAYNILASVHGHKDWMTMKAHGKQTPPPKHVEADKIPFKNAIKALDFTIVENPEFNEKHGCYLVANLEDGSSFLRVDRKDSERYFGEVRDDKVDIKYYHAIPNKSSTGIAKLSKKPSQAYKDIQINGPYFVEANVQAADLFSKHKDVANKAVEDLRILYTLITYLNKIGDMKGLSELQPCFDLFVVNSLLIFNRYDIDLAIQLGCVFDEIKIITPWLKARYAQSDEEVDYNRLKWTNDYGITIDNRIVRFNDIQSLTSKNRYKKVVLSQAIFRYLNVDGWGWLADGRIKLLYADERIDKDIIFKSVDISNGRIKFWNNIVLEDFNAKNSDLEHLGPNAQFGGNFQADESCLKSISKYAVFKKSVSIDKTCITKWIHDVPDNFSASKSQLAFIDKSVVFGGCVNVSKCPIKEWNCRVHGALYAIGSGIAIFKKGLVFTNGLDIAYAPCHDFNDIVVEKFLNIDDKQKIHIPENLKNIARERILQTIAGIKMDVKQRGFNLAEMVAMQKPYL